MSTLNDTTPTKRCSKCGTEFPATTEHFHRNSYGKFGLSYICKQCQAARSRAYNDSHKEKNTARRRAYREANKEQVAARDRVYRAEHKSERLDYQRQYRKQNRERLSDRNRQYQTVYRAKNANRLNQYMKQWRTENADHLRAYSRARYQQLDAQKRREDWATWSQSPSGRASRKASKHRYRARRLSAPGHYSRSDLAAIRAAQTDKRGRLRCWWCGKPIEGTPHLDHKIALVAGGANDAGNLCYTCAPCNQSKQAKTPAEFAGRLL